LSQFEYVAVLVSIIAGLALAQLLRGIGHLLTDKDWPKAYWVHTALTIYIFAYTTMFWWWEFQFVAFEWRISLYVLVVVYATLLFFAAIIVQPSNVSGIDNFKSYYYEKRHVIYGTWILVVIWDVVDTLAKGTGHLSDLGTTYVVGYSFAVIGGGIAIWTSNERYHQAFVIGLHAIFVRNMIVLFSILE